MSKTLTTIVLSLARSAAVVIMLWLYYSAFIVAFGAIFNSEAIEDAKPYATRVY